MDTPAFTHLGLTFRCGHYYLKRPRIVEKIVHDNRTFYAKFERIDELPTPLLSNQHLQGEYTVALPLVCDAKSDYIVFEYKGKEAARFAAFMKRLLSSKRHEPFEVFQGKSDEKVQVFLYVDKLDLARIETIVQTLSEWIEPRFGKDWKALPSSSLPDVYNIVTLPYKVYSFFPRL